MYCSCSNEAIHYLANHSNHSCCFLFLEHIVTVSYCLPVTRWSVCPFLSTAQRSWIISSPQTPTKPPSATPQTLTLSLRTWTSQVRIKILHITVQQVVYISLCCTVLVLLKLWMHQSHFFPRLVKIVFMYWKVYDMFTLQCTNLLTTAVELLLWMDTVLTNSAELLW